MVIGGEILVSVKAKNIKEVVEQASRVISQYWPMTSFVHHNPIHKLETLPFHEAVKVAHRFIGGHGYLTNEMYRKLVETGRIKSKHLDDALKSLATNKNIKLASQNISHFDVLRSHLLKGITAPFYKTIPSLVKRMPNKATIHSLASRLNFKLQSQEKISTIAKDITLSTWCDQNFNTQIVWQIDRELIKWCEAFIDEGHAFWSMPKREKGFYKVWKSLASKEWSPCGITASGKKIKALPESPELALEEHLNLLCIPIELRQDYLSLQLTALYGWSSFINWRSKNNDYQWQANFPIDLVQYLAVRLFYERELIEQTCKSKIGIPGIFDAIESYLEKKENTNTNLQEQLKLAAAWRLTKLANFLQISDKDLVNEDIDQLKQALNWLEDFPESEHGAIWLKAYEAGYREELIQKIKKNISKPKFDDNKSTRATAQILFCIDVRSEPFRRNLELVGNYETIGFAGFFGIPLSYRALDHKHETNQCPAILKPKYTVHEIVREGQNKNLAKHNSRKNFVAVLNEIFHDLKANLLSPYIMVETIGWLFGLRMLERTIFPGVYRKWRENFQRRLVPKLATKIKTDRDDLGHGLREDEQNSIIETALKTMGLTDNFARLVLIAGHTSISDNNPYEAALNCGACGGNSGEPNARAFASIANKAKVREYLAKNDIVIPQDTYFIGAVHNTTTDNFDLFDLEDLPDSHQQDIKNIKSDLVKAATKTNLERCIRLPGISKDLSIKRAVQEVTRRAGDWSETRPEWGLSGNASFIIARRSLTQEINLEGRAFLNSYDYRLDPDGTLLEGILMGPMLVGQWINAEHYFSATDTEIYGSGSKIYHNVVGRIGIMSGPQSDLRTGLAWQSVASGDMTYHEPLRLLVLIEAPQQSISEIINRQETLKQLCNNEWIHLIALDYENNKKLSLYQAKEGWIELN